MNKNISIITQQKYTFLWCDYNSSWRVFKISFNCDPITRGKKNKMDKVFLSLGGNIQVYLLLKIFIDLDNCNFSKHWNVRKYIEERRIDYESYNVFLNIINKFYGYIKRMKIEIVHI